MAKRDTKRPRGRPPVHPLPDPIDATPEEIAEVVLAMPPKAEKDWRYLKEAKARRKDREASPV